MDMYHTAYVITALFAGLSCAVSFHLVYRHLINYNEPRIQRYIVRLLWMVPIYAVDAAVSLRYPSLKLYLDAVRDCYEAYVLYTFFSLLLAYLDGIEALEELLEVKPLVSHPFPMCFLPKFRPGRTFLAWTRRSILQFVLLKPLLAISTLLLEFADLYDEGSLRLDRGYVYIAGLNNISITVSLYFLVLFYMVTEENLRPFNPLPKFLCIKAIIFFSFWQGLAVTLLVKLELIQNTDSWTAYEIGIAVQNTLISIEMFLLSMSHTYVFDYRPFIKKVTAPSGQPKDTLRRSRTSIELQEISPSTEDLPSDFELEVGGGPVRQSPSANRLGTPRNVNSTMLMKNLQDVADITDVIDDTIDALKPVKERHSKMP